jgi:hypothetical protein
VILEKAKCMLMSRYQKIGKKHTIKIPSRSFEDVASFKYLRISLADQNFIREEITNRINSGNTFYHSIQSLWSFRKFSRNVKFKIYKTKILPLAFSRCEVWPLTLE